MYVYRKYLKFFKVVQKKFTVIFLKILKKKKIAHKNMSVCYYFDKNLSPKIVLKYFFFFLNQKVFKVFILPFLYTFYTPIYISFTENFFFSFLFVNFSLLSILNRYFLTTKILLKGKKTSSSYKFICLLFLFMVIKVLPFQPKCLLHIRKLSSN